MRGDSDIEIMSQEIKWHKVGPLGNAEKKTICYEKFKISFCKTGLN